MSILGNIFNRLMGRPAAAAAAPSAPAPALQSVADMPAAMPVASPGSAPAAPSAPVPMSDLDLVAVMEAKAAAAGQKLNWRTSIVDLMKLLDLDSSLATRKQLAAELGYTGDMNDSATMNVWLHKQVMRKVAENGGQVPAELRD
jgi:hypothetical protein